jgi:hypothetical protein
MRRCADLAGFDDVVQGLHHLGGGGVGVKTVNLIQVDIVGAEAGQGGIDLLEDGPA